jgi:hypothetical protein
MYLTIKRTWHRVSKINWVGGLKNDEEGMMSNGKKVGYTGKKRAGKKECTRKNTHARTNIGIR